MKINPVVGYGTLIALSAFTINKCSKLYLEPVVERAAKTEQAKEKARNQDLATAVRNLRSCVTANLPKEDVYRGFELRFDPTSDGGKFWVGHIWTNRQATTGEQIRQRNAQERRCNKAAFGSAYKPS